LNEELGGSGFGITANEADGISSEDFAGLRLRPYNCFPKWKNTIYSRTLDYVKQMRDLFLCLG
jgi:hypothetical protein